MGRVIARVRCRIPNSQQPVQCMSKISVTSETISIILPVFSPYRLLNGSVWEVDGGGGGGGGQIYCSMYKMMAQDLTQMKSFFFV